MDELRFTEMLHQFGLKSTLPRVNILTILAGASEPLRIKDIADRLASKGLGADVVTIYRTIESFVEKHIVCRVDFEEDVAFYELVQANSDHHYICCTRCGKREPVDHCYYTENAERIMAKAPDFASITRHSIVFFGICKDCAAKPEEGRTSLLSA